MRKFLFIATILFTTLALPTFAQEPVVIVEPLIKTKWGQGGVFNDMFPKDNDGNNVLAGCGNVAWAQLLAYHRYPARGVGESGPTKVRYLDVPSVNFEVDYDWDNILDTYTSSATEQQRNAVATLIYHVGAARDGANKNDQERMVSVFGYDRSIQRLDRVFYTDNEWKAIIRQQLDLKRPVFYRGNDPESDHAFIIDGYDNAGNFHINWGWGGSKDGWYSLDNLLGIRKWFNNHNMTINMIPDSGGMSSGYELALRNFKVNKTSVPKNEIFTVTVSVRNNSNFDSFSGQYGPALVDNKDSIVAVLGTLSGGLGTTSYFSDRDINVYVPENIEAGQYNLRVVSRPTGGEWKIATLSAVGNGVPSTINITVTDGEAMGGGYGLMLEDFSPEKNAVFQNESFTVAVKPRNHASSRFSGQVGAALIDNDGNIVAVIGTRSIGLGAGYYLTSTITCTVPGTVPFGQYKLRIVARPTDEEWRIATLSLPDIPNSIDFGVIEPGAKGKVTFASADGNGTLTASVDDVEIASGDLVEHGKKAIFKAVPNNTHYIAGWTVNGVAIQSNATETLEITHFRDETIVTAIFGKKNFYHKIADYAKATENTVIAIDENDTLNSLVNIPAPAKEGVTLAIKSTDPLVPVTLRRGINGDLFTVSNGATLILENIIIHGGLEDKVIDDGDDDENIIISGDEDDSDDTQERANGLLARVNNGGTFVMKEGAVLRNNANSAATGGVNVASGGTFIMDGGEITGNVTVGTSGGVATAGTFTMNAGKITSNFAGTDGGGVRVSDGTFTMNGGEISGNTASLNGGGIRLTGGTFTMQAGKISGNTAIDGGGLSMIGTSTTFTMNGGEIIGNAAGTGGGGIRIGGGTFTMNGGEIIGNTAPTGNGIRRAGGTVNLNGGVIAGTGTNIAAVVNGTHNLNKSEGAPNNAAIIAWNKPNGTLNYTLGTSTNLTASSGATAVWQNKDGKLGIQYENGENTGFIAISESGGLISPAILPQIAKTTIKAHYANKTIMLENVPANAKVEIYNLQGKRIYNSQLSTFNSQLRIGVQTGFYIVKINNQTLRVAVR